jgi:hypothetical protein
VPSLCAEGDVEDCLVQPLPQGQFTPLPEALCWVILDLTSSGQAAVLERIRSALQVAFPDIQRPSQEIVYDALAKLTIERKVSKARCLTLVFCCPPTSLTSLPTALLPGVRSRVCSQPYCIALREDVRGQVVPLLNEAPHMKRMGVWET